MDFLAVFKVFGLDAADDADGAETILDSGQAPSPHAQGWNRPQGETPRSDTGTINPELMRMSNCEPPFIV